MEIYFRFEDIPSCAAIFFDRLMSSFIRIGMRGGKVEKKVEWFTVHPPSLCELRRASQFTVLNSQKQKSKYNNLDRIDMPDLA
jgi:hypothetical protein